MSSGNCTELIDIIRGARYRPTRPRTRAREARPVGQQPFSSIIGSATPRGVGVPGPLGITLAVVDGDLALGATRSTLAQTSNRTVTCTAAAPRLWDGIEIPQLSDSSPTKIDSVYTD